MMDFSKTACKKGLAYYLNLDPICPFNWIVFNRMLWNAWKTLYCSHVDWLARNSFQNYATIIKYKKKFKLEKN